MITLSHIRIAIAVLGIHALWPRAAKAQPPAWPPSSSSPSAPQTTAPHFEAAHAHFEAAEAAKERGDYAFSARKYLAAYQEFPHPEFLFNVGEVYRLAGDKQQAIEYFQKYLALDPNGRGAASARTHIDALTAAIEIEQAEVRPHTDEELSRTAAASKPSATDRPTVKSAPARPTPRPGGRLRIAGATSGAVGVVALGTSLFFGLRARSLADQASDVDVYDPGLDDRGETAERTMLITAVIGTVALGAGVALYFLGRRIDAADRPSLTVSPLLTPSSLTVGASVRF